ncbi:MAG: 30S ribosomal protein S12 methylthiotransferase RimO [Lachnospiraceae bacterium]|nr:30S ribosomal protein S12 methylthiotransferase RimO [Lachnospiraceae bacterium]
MKIFFVSLGCDKNLSDSEHMLYLLHNAGHEITDFEEEADIFIINSCSFIEDALKESIDAVLSYVPYKEKGASIILTGCMAERFKDEIRKELPEVDVMVGTNSYDEIVKAVNDCAENKKTAYFHDFDRLPAQGTKRLLSNASGYAYLKIADGCDKCCTYCAIPSFRGKYRSFPMEDILSEAEFLASQGIKELILVAQETTLYGLDIYKKKCLPALLSKLSEIDGIEWIRLLYCYPEEITEELISEIRDNKKVLHYIDMPIQHSSDHVLRSMGRRTDNESLRKLITHLREEIPDITLRTTVIAGFPGEMKDDHDNLLDFINDMEFDRLGCFKYSKEEGTKAALMDDQISDSDKEERFQNIMLLEQDILFEKNRKLTGEVMTVMVDGYIPEEDVYIARSYRDAPDVDGYVFFKGSREYMTGDMVKIRVSGSHEYDLLGEEII